MLAQYPLPPVGHVVTTIAALHHSSFGGCRNPFHVCYYSYRSKKQCDWDACSWLRQFGPSKDEQTYNYYLWSQTFPIDVWPIFKRLHKTAFVEYVADAVPPYGIWMYLVVHDIAYYFRDAMVLDLYSGVCGWLMAFFFGRIKPRRWVAVDVDTRRLQICREIAHLLGVDIVTIRRDLSISNVDVGNVDVVVGSPPCHEFSIAKVSNVRRVDDGLFLVRRYFEIVEQIKPQLAVFEEAASIKAEREKIMQLAKHYGFYVEFYDFSQWTPQLRKRIMGYRRSVF